MAVPTDGLSIAQQTDLGPDGTFGEQWLLINGCQFMVIALEKGQARLMYQAALEDIDDAQVEPAVGNALLRLTVIGQSYNLLHFSNELTEQFALIAHYLRQRKEDHHAPVPDFEGEGQRCLSCGKRLLDSSLKVCPNCIQKGQVMRRLLLLARPFWGLGCVHLVLMLMGVMVDLLPPYLTRVLIDDVLTRTDAYQLADLAGVGIAGDPDCAGDHHDQRRAADQPHLDLVCGRRAREDVRPPQNALAGFLRPQRNRALDDAHQPGYGRTAGPDQSDVAFPACMQCW